MSLIEKGDLEENLLGITQKNNNESKQGYKTKQSRANPLSRILFWWIVPLIKVKYLNFFNAAIYCIFIKQGNIEPLEQQHLEQLGEEQKAEFYFNKFSMYLQMYRNTSKEPLIRTLLSTFKSILAVFWFNLFLTIYTLFEIGTIRISMLIAFFQCLMVMTTPILIKEIIQYVGSSHEDNTKGVLLIFAMIITNILNSLFETHANFRFSGLGYDLTNTVGVALFSKSLRYSLLSTDDYKVGSLINMLQVDAQRLINLCSFISNLMFLPFQLIIGLFIMYYTIGISFLFGFGVMLIMCSLNYLIGRQSLRIQKLQMAAKDERMKATTEVLSAIKFIKSNAWEEYFYDKIDEKRQIELKYTNQRFICGSLSIFSLWITPNLIINATFAAFVLLGNEMTAESAFTVISIFSILQEPIRSMPVVINSFIETHVAIKRIEKYLLSKEIDNSIMSQKKYSQDEYALKIKNGYFMWREASEDIQSPNQIEKFQKKNPLSQQFSTENESENDNSSRNSSVIDYQKMANFLDEKEGEEQIQTENKEDDKQYILKDINITIPLGSFVAFIGEVGSGKSSFLQSLIGEMKFTDERRPKVEINGDLSMVSQKPWIMNATVKDNILFGKEYDDHKYKECLKYSCMVSDLKVLSDGDMTQIGEKGINLSGGQKARISLARALYSESSILLLDDILSAVDVHVGKSLVKDCLMKYKKHATRVLATHALHFLKYVDLIYILKDGRIVEQGKYEQIYKSQVFKSFYHQYMKDHEQETSTGIIIEDQQLEEILDDNPIQNDQDETTQDDSNQESTSEDENKNIQSTQAKSKNEFFISNIQTSNRNQDAVISSLNIENKSPSKNGNSNTQNIDVQQESKQDVTVVVENQDFLMLKEERQKGEISYKIIKLLVTLNGGFWYVCGILITMTIWLGLKMGSSIWIAYWTQSNDPDNSDFYLNIFSLFSISYGVFALIRAVIILFSSVKAARILHRSMISALIFAPLTEFFERVPLGRLLNVLSKDIQVMDQDFGYNIGNFMVNIFSLFGDTILCVYASSYVVLLPIAIYMVSCKLISDYYMTAQREVVRLETVSRSPIISYYAESLSGLSTIRAFNRQEHFLKNHCLKIDENKKCQFATIALGAWFNQVLTFLSLIVNICAVYFCIFYGNKNSSITGLLLTFAFSINQNVYYLINSSNNFQKNMVSLERGNQITQVKPENGYQTYLDNRTNIKQKKTSDSLTNWPSVGCIDFTNFSLKYRPNLPKVIKNIQVSIKSSEKIGIVGRTGAGKSTITLSLLRILEAFEGQIIIDGLDISKIRLDQLRQKITIILQDPQLFEGSLRENIDPLNQFTDENIKQTLSECQLQRFALSSEGLNTKICEGGENLSVGEKQLVCIARALLKKSKIVLIDEATANIDVQTDHLIQQTIANVFKDCTVLTIAHRLNTIMSSDRILVLSYGEVAEFDTPSNLLNNPQSAFYSLHQESMKENKL